MRSLTLRGVLVASTLAETRTYLGGLVEIPRMPVPELEVVGTP